MERASLNVYKILKESLQPEQTFFFFYTSSCQPQNNNNNINNNTFYLGALFMTPKVT